MKSKPTLQQLALAHPCHSFMDLTDLRHKKIKHIGNMRISLLITIDAYAGEPRWHASGAILSPSSRPYDLRNEVSQADYDKMFDFIYSQLKAVGEGIPYSTEPETILHFFKKLTPEEMIKVKRKKGH